MKTLFSFLFGALFIAVLAAPVLLVVALVEERPLVVTNGEVSHTDIERAKVILLENDPRTMKAGEERLLSIEERDLNILARYGMSRLRAGGAAIELWPNGMDFQATFTLPANPLGSYVNVRLFLAQDGQQLRVKKLQAGRLSVPAAPATWLVHTVHRKFIDMDRDYRNLFQALKSFQLTEEYLLLVYQWQPRLVKRIVERGKKAVVSAPDQERLLEYYQQLVRLSKDPALGVKVGFDRLLGSMLAVAGARSQNGSDPIAENRAALLVLALYVSGINPDRVLGEAAAASGRPARHDVLLRGRKDLAKHFIISVGLKVAGGSSIANALGLFKEVDDSRGGSGFSFIDLAADRAGVRFAVLAVGSPTTAEKIQRLAARGLDEADFMPSIAGLPEFLQEQEFLTVYGGVDHPRYRVLADEIERRIDRIFIHGEM